MAAPARRPVRRPRAAFLRRGLIPVLSRYLPQDRLTSLPTRAMVFAPLVVVWATIVQALDRRDSDRAATYRVGHWLQLPVNSRSGALCKARARLPQGLLREVGQGVAEGLRPVGRQRLRGRRIVVLDGSSLTVPDTPENRAYFGLPAGQKPGCGYPVLDLEVLMDGRTGAVLDWAVAPHGTSELVLVQQLLRSLRPGDILVADRYYGTYGFLAQMRSLQVAVVTRQHQRRQNRGRPEGAREWEETWARPDDLHEVHQDLCWEPDQQVRVLWRERAERETLKLVTTLTRAEAPARVVQQWYRDRWRIETQLKQLKTGQQAEFVSARSPAAVEQAVAGHILALNLLCAWRCEVARAVQQDPWQMSLTGLRDGVLTTVGDGRSVVAQRQWLVACGRAEKVPQRPGRNEPRRVKRRPKPFTYLTQPRDELRTQLMGGR